MPDAHAPRATDLVALVTFDGQVRENLAVTREHLGLGDSHEQRPPRPLSAAIEQWLHLGRRTWVSIEGREVRGIATARELGDASAWEIDALIDAGDEHVQPGDAPADVSAEAPVLVDLLSRAASAAVEAGVTRVLLRTPSTIAAGERYALASVPPCRSSSGAATTSNRARHTPASACVRRPRRTTTPQFQLYMRSVRAETRALMAMTFGEWASLQSRRWLGRQGIALAAECEGRVIGHLRCAPASGQLELLVDPDQAEAATDALLDAATEAIDAERMISLCETDAPQACILERRGMRAQQEYMLLARRTTTPVAEAAAVPVNARLA